MDAVLDVGGVYDSSRDRYDHHQNGFDEAFGHGFATKLSTAGLVYKVFSLCLTYGFSSLHLLFKFIFKCYLRFISQFDSRNITLFFLAFKENTQTHTYKRFLKNQQKLLPWISSSHCQENSKSQ